MHSINVWPNFLLNYYTEVGNVYILKQLFQLLIHDNNGKDSEFKIN